MDILLPFVDISDPEWQVQFLLSRRLPCKNQKLRDIALKAFRKRFDSYGLLKYWFRALCENYKGPFTVHLLLMQESQYPGFLVEGDPRIVVHYHREFMPVQLLPSFNSSAIELCAMRELSLSPVYLLANDDMYFNRPVGDADYSEGSAPLTHIAIKDRYHGGLFQTILENGRRLVEEDTRLHCPHYAWHHVIQAYSDSYCKGFLGRHWGDIVKRLHKNRDPMDVNHLMLMMGQDVSGVSISSDRYPWQGYFECPWLRGVTFERLASYRVLCLNDVDGSGLQYARAYLESRYPEKCPLEK